MGTIQVIAESCLGSQGYLAWSKSASQSLPWSFQSSSYKHYYNEAALLNRVDPKAYVERILQAPIERIPLRLGQDLESLIVGHEVSVVLLYDQLVTGFSRDCLLPLFESLSLCL